jgi:hypothetical protein
VGVMRESWVPLLLPGRALVDAGEERGEAAGAGAGREDAPLIVTELHQHQFQMSNCQDLWIAAVTA